LTLKLGSEASSVAWSSDGRRIVTGSDDKLVRVWDALTAPGSGNELVLLPLMRRLWSLLAFTHTGWLLSPAGEGYLMFVPLDAPNILAIPSSRASSVDFSRASLGPR